MIYPYDKHSTQPHQIPMALPSGMCEGAADGDRTSFEPEGSDVDRVFNSDPYSMENCILIERGLNFAKGTMKEFLTSEDFPKDLRKGSRYCGTHCQAWKRPHVHIDPS
ncbi:hypothetical protein K457DRAFT_1818304 [Linnemannia elongata AG-77]|uniref:Uncharacterized protein n=1 Tax=Linnemannia elongata AG-77 TaxID=1314771 RepID=A0A197K393_9FUNG|nr:hypothetical protein K457DRAFT_1818304 [Linnemannia elongata AG-77]